MDLEEAREISQMGWPENQKAQRQHDAVDWLVAEVERLEGELRATAEHWKETDERCGELQSSLTLSREEGRREGMMTSAEVLQSRLSVMMATPIVQAPVREWIEEHLTEVLAAIRSEAKGETHQG